MRLSSLCLSGVVCLLAACAANPPAATAPAKSTTGTTYTSDESSKLAYCDALTVNAWIIAIQKQSGTSADEVKAQYANSSADVKPVLLKTVDKVYAESSDKPWDYAVSFYKDCATNVAAVPVGRSDFATFCMMNSLIAQSSLSMRAVGKSKEEAEQAFAGLKGDLPKKIVDSIYAPATAPSRQVDMEVFNKCLTRTL